MYQLGVLAVRIKEMFLQRNLPDQAERFETVLTASMFLGTAPNELVLLNRFWRFQLARHAQLEAAEAARTWLCDSDDPQAWLGMFENVILPLVIHLDLPRME